MKKQILFIHGAGEGAFKEDKKLSANLQKELGTSYEVHFPKMKNEEDADYDTWANQVKEELTKLGDDVIVVGHSVGGSIVIKLLSSEKVQQNIAGVFLIAAPFWGGDGGWTYDGYETLELPAVPDIKPGKAVPMFLYHSSDDETVPFDHMALFSKVFPKATERKVDGGHQLDNDLSKVADDIKSTNE